jgi:anti-anti-sigma factor
MGRDLAVSAVRTPKEGGTQGSAADGTHTAFEKNGRTQDTPSERHLALADAKVRMHTLVLTGELDRRSAHTLEAEIEHLCEEGVTGITLDLRGLAYVDWIGVAVIAFRCSHCLSRGYEFALIPGSPSIQRAFEQAGVSDSLPFLNDDVAGALVSPAHT